ncbi:uncharacterized protein LOC113306930 [Papaver somniferum]|uniref:uncharacterized protein LOC113306930 n=1 Tax=Papaver somniferum TaxID=3469 RepID=UPI000E6FEDBD|nr:uncharacterized protein LOC113306930 [Papaver somniferum]
MNTIKKLQDPQSELLLLRNCTGVSKLYFTLRKTFPSALQPATIQFDTSMFQYLRNLIVGDGDGFGVIQQRMVTLPIKDGGLGVYTMADTFKYCYLASCAQTRHLQDVILQHTTSFDVSQQYHHALQVYIQICGLSPSQFNINDVAPHLMKSLAATYFDAIKKELPNKYSLSARDIDLWQCNRTKHAMDFLKVVPIHGLNQAVVPRQFRAVLNYRYLLQSRCSRSQGGFYGFLV